MNHNRFNDQLAAKRNRIGLATNRGRSQFAGGASALPQVIDQGKPSPFRKNGRLHRMAIAVTLINNDATNRADVILSAGKHGTNAAYSPQLVTDGTNATTNDDSVAVSVDLVSKYGVDKSMNWAHWQRVILEEGLSITGFSLLFQTQAQLTHRFMLEKRDNFGAHDVDIIDPMIEYDPSQYDNKIIRIPQGFPLTKDYILKYSLEPSEKVTIQLFLGGIYNPQAIIEQLAAAGGEVAGL